MPLPAILLGLLVGGSQAVTRNREQQRKAQAERAKEERALNAALFKSYATDEKGRGQQALSAVGVSSFEDFNDPDKRLGVMNIYGKLASLPDIGDGKAYGSGDNRFVIQPYGYFEGNDQIKTFQYLNQFEVAASNGRLQNYLNSVDQGERTAFLRNIQGFADSYFQEQYKKDSDGNVITKIIPFDKRFKSLNAVMAGNYSADPNLPKKNNVVSTTQNGTAVKVTEDGNLTGVSKEQADKEAAAQNDINSTLNIAITPEYLGTGANKIKLIETHNLGLSPDVPNEQVIQALSARISERVGKNTELIPIVNDILAFENMDEIITRGSFTGTSSDIKLFQSIYNKHVLSRGGKGSSLDFIQAMATVMPIQEDVDLPALRPVSPGVKYPADEYATLQKTWEETAMEIFGLGEIKDLNDRREAATKYFNAANNLKRLYGMTKSTNLELAVSKLGAQIFNVANFATLIANEDEDGNLSNYLGNTFKNKNGADFLKNATIKDLINFYTYELAYYRARAFEGNSARLSEQDFRRAMENVSGGLFELRKVTDLRIEGITKQAEFDRSFFQVLKEAEDASKRPMTEGTAGEIRLSVRQLKALQLIKDKILSDDPIYRSYVPTASSVKRVPNLKLNMDYNDEGFFENTPVYQAVTPYGDPAFEAYGGRFFLLDKRFNTYVEVDKRQLELISDPKNTSQDTGTEDILPTPPGAGAIPSGKESDENKQSDTEGVPEDAEFLYESGGLKYYRLPDGTVMVK